MRSELKVARQSERGGSLRGARDSDAAVGEAEAGEEEGAVIACRLIKPLSDVSATPAILYLPQLSRNLNGYSVATGSYNG